MTIPSNITDPQANDILIYSELEQKFVNTAPSLSLFGSGYLTNVMNIGNSVPIFNDIQSGTVRFRTLKGDGSITVSSIGTEVQISFDGDADTLGGSPKSSFLLVSENLSEVDPTLARNNLNVYSTNEVDNIFMEINGSNIPDLDNTYDLGSNGRRYANIFAVTFHGTATEALYARKLIRNGANNGDVLTWDDGEYNWIPKPPASNFLNTLDDVDVSNLQNESVLVFNAVRNRWEAVPASFTGGGVGGGDVEGENIGSGVGTFVSKFGQVLQFRSLTGTNGINVSTNFDGSEVVISSNHATSTDALPEGSTNLYYTNNRVTNHLRTLSINEHVDVDTSGIDNNNVLAWNATEGKFKPVNVPVGLSNTDGLPEGSNNLYFTQSRAYSSITSYLTDVGISLNSLSDVSVTSTANTFLYYDSNSSVWSNRSLSLNDISEIDITGISDGFGLKWNASLSKFTVAPFATKLFDLSETVDSYHFNSANLGTLLGTVTTDSLPEGVVNHYYTDSKFDNRFITKSIGDLNDVDMSGVQNGNILVWDSASGMLKPASSEDLNINVNLSTFELGDVDPTAINPSNDDILVYNSTTSQYELLKYKRKLVEHEDVDVTNITNNNGLVWENTKFVNKPVATLSGTFTNGSYAMFQNGNFVASSGIAVDIDDIGRVDISNLSNGDVLIYSDSDNVFVNMPAPWASSLGQLTDVNLVSLAANDTIVFNGLQFVNVQLPPFNIIGSSNDDILIYNSTNEVYENKNIFDIIGIDVNNPVENQVLKYDVGSGKFINGGFTVTGVTFNSLTDVILEDTIHDTAFVLVPTDSVNGELIYKGQSLEKMSINIFSDVYFDINTINDGDTLRWDSDYDQFVPTSTGTDISLIDLEDFVTQTPNNGDIIRFNGTEFVFEPLQVSTSLNDLTDTANISTAQDGQVLTFNGVTGKFEPQDPTGGTGGAPLGGVYERVAIANQTDFFIPHEGMVFVSANGFVVSDSDLDLSDPSKITFKQARDSGDIIKIMVVSSNINTPIGAVQGEVVEFISSTGQTEFLVNHNGMVLVTANGFVMSSSAININDTSKIVFNTARNANDIIKVVVFAV